MATTTSKTVPAFSEDVIKGFVRMRIDSPAGWALAKAALPVAEVERVENISRDIQRKSQIKSAMETAMSKDARGESFEDSLVACVDSLAIVAENMESVFKGEDKGERGAGSKRYMHRVFRMKHDGAEVVVNFRREI